MIILSPQYEVDITINDQRPLANKIDKDHHSRAWSVLWQRLKVGTCCVISDSPILRYCEQMNDYNTLSV